ncbi:MAG: large conductance mechanosensitive channel protein MscL [Acutalibacteraceae bacterium]
MGKSSFFKDFKAFITKGNIIDMAVGVIIGGAFGKIVSSLVADIITPLISLALGKTDFTEIVWTLREATEDSEAIVMNGGTFIQTVIDFLIIALCIFIVLRIAVGHVCRRPAAQRRKRRKPGGGPPAPSPSRRAPLCPGNPRPAGGNEGTEKRAHGYIIGADGAAPNRDAAGAHRRQRGRAADGRRLQPDRPRHWKQRRIPDRNGRPPLHGERRRARAGARWFWASPALARGLLR